MKSERQKSLKRKTILFGVLSYGLLFVLSLVYLISAFANFNLVKDGVQIFTEEAKKIVNYICHWCHTNDIPKRRNENIHLDGMCHSWLNCI